MGRNLMRKGVAMIELIFAIVVMGIVLMSAPMLISTASSSGYASMQQEGINEVASQINIILGYAWDEGNTIDSRSAVILGTAGDSDLNELTTTGRRAGTPLTSFRTFIDDNASTWNASAIGGDGTADSEKDDMDDFNGTTILKEIEADDEADYIEKEGDISITSNIDYIDDAANYLDPGTGNTVSFTPNFSAAAPNPTSNIKKISATLTSSSGVDELRKEITLHAFSCNLGAYQLEER